MLLFVTPSVKPGKLYEGPWCVSRFVALWHRGCFQTGMILVLLLLSQDNSLCSPGMLLQLLLVRGKLCCIVEWETCEAPEHAFIFQPSFKYLFVCNFYFRQLLHFALVMWLISRVVAEEESGSDSELIESCMVAVKSGGLLPVLPAQSLGLWVSLNSFT